MSTEPIKESFPLYRNMNPSLLAAMGFGVGSLLSLHLILEPGISIPGIISGGVGGGLALAYATERRSATVRAMFGFGTAFLIGGTFSGLGILLLQISAPFFYFYFLYIIGFVISGVLSALFTRSQFVAVKNSAIAFMIAGMVGGAVIGSLYAITGSQNVFIDIAGLFITNVIGGALCGAVLEPMDIQTPAEPEVIRQE